MRIGEGSCTTVSHYMVLVLVVVVILLLLMHTHSLPLLQAGCVFIDLSNSVLLLPGLLDQLQRMAKKDEAQLRAELRRRHLPVETSTSNTKLLSRLRRPWNLCEFEWCQVMSPQKLVKLVCSRILWFAHRFYRHYRGFPGSLYFQGFPSWKS